jgi:AcrR family transcriptional regulator
MTSPKPTPAADVPSDRSVRILEAACRVIVRDGAHGLRMAAVAREAQVSKALVHYYFATRQELLRHTLEFSERRSNAALEAELEGATTAAERLERMLLSSLAGARPFSEQRALGNEVWSSLRTDEQLRPLVERSYGAWIDRLVATLEEGRSDGSVPESVDAKAAGWRLAAVADGLDSLLYLEMAGRARATALLRGAIAAELAAG